MQPSGRNAISNTNRPARYNRKMRAKAKTVTLILMLGAVLALAILNGWYNG